MGEWQTVGARKEIVVVCQCRVEEREKIRNEIRKCEIEKLEVRGESTNLVVHAMDGGRWVGS